MLTFNPDQYLVRWRFEFSNRSSRYGQWSRPATHEKDMAAFRLAEGLVLAAIEIQDVQTQEITTAVACDGWDYVNFKWIGAAYGYAGGFQKIVGMTLVTRDWEYSVMTDGQVFKGERTPQDKTFHYATFGK
jgi:hypothetical protein